jgi:hypothetical protein
MAVGVLDAPKTPATPAADWTHDPEQTPIPESLLAFFGAALLGAPVRFDPPTVEAAAEPLAVHALVGPTAWLDAYDCGPQCTALGYGDSPADPSIVHFEKQLWSENPIEPPDRVAPEDVALLTADAEYTHRDLLDAATAVVEEYALTSDDSVAVRTPLSWLGTVVAGVLAPLSVGAAIHVGDADEASAVVATDDEWSGRRIDPAAVYEGRT